MLACQLSISTCSGTMDPSGSSNEPFITAVDRQWQLTPSPNMLKVLKNVLNV